MAYIGKVPTAAALTASDVTDGIITTAKLAADAVTDAKIADDVVGTEHLTAGEVDATAIASDAITLAKMASGTDGNIISYDASGNPVAISTGSDGQVLTSAGAGAPPAFEAAGGAIVSVGFAENSTRYSFSNSADNAVFTVTFAKTLAADASKIIVHGLISLLGQNSNFSGLYFDCLTANVTAHNTDDSKAFKGINMTMAHSTATPANIIINQEWEDTTNLGAATHTFEFGWKMRNGASGYPSNQLNPTSTDDARMHAKSSTFTFFEVAI